MLNADDTDFTDILAAPDNQYNLQICKISLFCDANRTHISLIDLIFWLSRFGKFVFVIVVAVGYMSERELTELTESM